MVNFCPAAGGRVWLAAFTNVHGVYDFNGLFLCGESGMIWEEMGEEKPESEYIVSKLFSIKKKKKNLPGSGDACL